MKRMSHVFFALLLALAFATKLLSEEKPQANYTVAVILPMTGVGASVGEAIQNGIRLAYDELPLEIQKRLHIIYEDDGSQSMRAVAAFQKINASNKLSVVITALSNSGHAIKPYAESAGISHISISIDPSIAENAKHLIVLWSPLNDVANLTVREALRRGYKKVAVVSLHHEGNIAMRKAFLEANHGQLVTFELPEFDPNETDYSSILARLRMEKDVDAIATFIHFGRVGLFTKQARQKGIKLPFFGFFNFEDMNALRASDGALLGQWYVGNANPSKDFTKRYFERFPNASLFGAPNGHDAILLLAETLKNNVPDGEVSSFLLKIKDFRGAMGTISARPDHLFSVPIAVKEVTKDGFKELSR